MIVDAAILAAGASRRLGRAKQALEIEGRPLLTRAVEAAIAVSCRRVIVMLGHDAGTLAALVPPGAETVVHPGYVEGLGSTIRAAIDAVRRADELPDGLLLAVCDQAALDASILRGLLDRWQLAGRPYAAGCEYGGKVGTPAVFSPEAFPDLAGLSGDRGARALLRTPGRAVVRVPWPAGALDVDLPCDLP
jgi:CTP:molybdopterin cytidylyltransferase MocA